MTLCIAQGDSIVLGFHDANSAALAAGEAQASLLDAQWPAALLEDPLCAPLYVSSQVRNVCLLSHRLGQSRGLHIIDAVCKGPRCGALSMARRLHVLCDRLQDVCYMCPLRTAQMQGTQGF